ncbi:MAG: hypothetical protein IID51_03010 [Proteobacteria bacterium]|nr:hypothetical protein [Pseudomonadota bacterium]
MLKNYITIAIRSILKNKLFAAINIGGLAIGLAIFIFAQLFAGYERSHHAFFENSDRRPKPDTADITINAVTLPLIDRLNNRLKSKRRPQDRR